MNDWSIRTNSERQDSKTITWTSPRPPCRVFSVTGVHLGGRPMKIVQLNKRRHSSQISALTSAQSLSLRTSSTRQNELGLGTPQDWRAPNGESSAPLHLVGLCEPRCTLGTGGVLSVSDTSISLTQAFKTQRVSSSDRNDCHMIEQLIALPMFMLEGNACDLTSD